MDLCLQVLLLIDIELSYINTNHEDFIGFAKYVYTLTCVCISVCFTGFGLCWSSVYAGGLY